MKLLIITVSLVLLYAQESLAQLYTVEQRPQEWCMAQNIYYEARGSSLADQAAVADVVLNRMQDRRYPSTICEVVQQGKKYASGQMKRNKCQFSWYCDGKSDWPTDKDAWHQAQQIAYLIIHMDRFRGLTEGATHYHAHYVDPNWASSLQMVGTVGDHVYYRWME